MNNLEEQFGRKVVGYLGATPKVSEDVAARLAFARSLALQKARSTQVPEKASQVIALNRNFVGIKRLVLGALLVATVLVYFQPDQGTDLSPEQETELQYHQTADQPFSGEY